MAGVNQPVILASGSPRRSELLRKIVPDFTVVPANIDEVIDQTLPIEKAIEELALKKAQAVAKLYPDAIVIGGDTLVCLNDEILTKPKDSEDAKAMLKRLSGQKQKVVTGVAVVNMDGRTILFHAVSIMKFRELSDSEIEDYVNSGEPLDKAGGYAVQGGARDFIDSLDGELDTIVGLPIKQLQLVLNS